MKRSIFTKSFAAAAFVLGALGAASTAHARSDVYFSVGVQSPGVYVQPAPVYVQPRPVYVAPQPVYVESQQVYQPGHDGRPQYEDDRGRYDSHAWQRRGPYGDHDRDGIANVNDPDSPRNQRRWARLYGPYGDLDRDGVMNMDDRDRDRDGDGVRNRHDRFPDDPYRY